MEKYLVNMDLNGLLVIDQKSVHGLINTLKEIDVRGFDSMDRLVGAVAYLQNIAAQEPISCEPYHGCKEEDVCDG